jgi:hypothetical protein
MDETLESITVDEALFHVLYRICSLLTCMCLSAPLASGQVGRVGNTAVVESFPALGSMYE